MKSLLKSIIKKEYLLIKKELLLLLRTARFFIITNGCNDIPRGVLPSSTKLSHNGIGVVIASKAKIGENCFIGQNVTVGSIHKGNKNKIGEPVIEDNVTIKAHSCVIGGITIGHDSVIGASAIVYKDVPPYSLVVGNCKIYKDKYRRKSD